MIDGSTDKNDEEVIVLVTRNVVNFTICESVLKVGTVQHRSAKGLLGFVEVMFEKYGVDKGGAVSQAYDGASVMSGEFIGLKKLFCVFCGKTVLYIHCYCHRRHLIVIAVLGNIPDFADHIPLVSSLYNFFYHP